jgi:hypothetical protein
MHSHEHVVQPYGTDERRLARYLSGYVAEGSARGDALRPVGPQPRPQPA